MNEKIKYEPWLEPCWTDAGRVQDWRNYVSQTVRAMWDSFTKEQQEALYCQADDQASAEMWD